MRCVVALLHAAGEERVQALIDLQAFVRANSELQVRDQRRWSNNEENFCAGAAIGNRTRSDQSQSAECERRSDGIGRCTLILHHKTLHAVVSTFPASLLTSLVLLSYSHASLPVKRNSNMHSFLGYDILPLR